MRCGHLFNGIGGFALAASWMGWENVFHCEIDGYCNKVMKRHFPNSIEYGDIKQQNFNSYLGTIDLLTGGFPCQPYSTAGKRLGKADERHLWPEMLRAVREIRPRWLVGENVRGLTNWNAGVVFDEVQADLETEGYEVLPFLLPAAGVGAPHGRQRIWFVAHSVSHDARRFGYGQIGCPSGGLQGEKKEWERVRADTQRIGEERTPANSESQRCGKERKGIGRSEKRSSWSGSERVATDTVQHDGGEIQIEKRNAVVGQEHIGSGTAGRNIGWDSWPAQHPVSSGDDGVSAQLAGLTISQYRRASIAALGNAIVPQVVLQIFKSIEAFDGR